MSQFNTPTYDIERPTGTCAFTGRQLEPGERYVATLVEIDPEQEGQTQKETGKPGSTLPFKRLDVCMEAWEQGNRPDRLFSHWVSTVPQPTEKKKIFVDDAVLMNLLIRLGDTEEPQRLAFRFVLALILMRKKLLRYDRTERRPKPAPAPVGAEGSGEHNEQPAEPVMEEYWVVTPKLDITKGPLGKWNEEEQFEVLNPQLDETQIQQVTEQLGEILEAEL